MFVCNIGFQFLTKNYLLDFEEHNMFKRRKRKNKLMNDHYPLKSSQRSSSSMNINKCFVPTFLYDPCINFIGWRCTQNHQHHETSWIQDWLFYHERRKFLLVNEWWSLNLKEEMKKWKLNKPHLTWWKFYANKKQQNHGGEK